MPDIPNLDDINGIEKPKSEIMQWYDDITEMIDKAEAERKAKEKKKVSKRQSPATKQLNETVRQYKIKCTALGRDKPHCIPDGELHENSASMVQSCIIAYIGMMPRGYAFQVGGKGTPRKNKDGKTIMTQSKDTNGISDVLAVVNGRMLGIEVKFSKRDKQSSAQMKFEKRITQAGGSYMLVKNFTDFLPKFEAWYTGKQQPTLL